MIIYRAYTERGTFGKWYDHDHKFICYSLERPWRNNQPFVSCVPEGEYGLQEYSSTKYPDTYALVNTELGVSVYGGEDTVRSHILIHAANTASELAGCIAPGMGCGVFGHEWGVSFSNAALRKVKKVAATEGILSIRVMRAQDFYPTVKK